VSHHTADAHQRGRLAFTAAGVRSFLHAARSLAAGVLEEAVVLSTCNRVEFYVVTQDLALAERALRVLVADLTGADALAPGEHRYVHHEEEACRHLARVACGLDSLVLGEAEILGQVRAAVVLAREAGTLGPRLDRVMAAAQGAGGRARSETAIGIGSTSVATAAVALGERVLRGLAGKSVVIVGAGQAGRLALSRVLKRRAGAVTVVNRTPARAEAAVAATTARGCGLDRLPDALAGADLVIVAAHGHDWMISEALLRQAGRAAADGPRDLDAFDAATTNSGHRLVIVDIAMPTGVEPSVRQLRGVRVFGLDELRGVIEDTHRRRLAVVPIVEAIAAEEAGRAWRQWVRRDGGRPADAPSGAHGAPYARGPRDGDEGSAADANHRRA
jgi:glutamyl-tRNA reductase